MGLEANSVLQEVFGDKIKSIDDGTYEYICSIVDMHIQDKSAQDQDLIESLVPLLEASLGEEVGKLESDCKLILERINPNSSTEAVGNKPILTAPVMIAKSIIEQEKDLKQIWKQEFGSIQVNYNSTIETHDIGDGTLDAAMSDKEQRDKSKRSKNIVKMDKKDTVKEKVGAEERGEILQQLAERSVAQMLTFNKNNESSLGGRDIKLENVSMTLGTLELLNEVTITFSYGRKYGLIGKNGIGKSTLLRHLAAHAFPGIPDNLKILYVEQEVEATDDSVLQTVLKADVERDLLVRESKLLQMIMDADSESPGSSTKYAEQDTFGLLKLTTEQRSQKLAQLYNYLQEIEADRAVSRASAILSGLGFSPEMQEKSVSSYSGGFRMRVSLAKALFLLQSDKVQVVLLDEPTNHLDLLSVLWLEDYLQTYSKTLIIVSHDRDFLNAVVTDIVHMENKNLHRYKGNYDHFEKQRAEKLRTQKKAQETQEKEIAQIQKFIDKNRANASTAKMAQSRVKRLEKMTLIPEIFTDPQLQWNIPEPDLVMGYVIQFMDVTFTYDSAKPPIYKNVHFGISMDNKIALVGENGVGKSTLLKMMYGEIEPTSGMVKINPKARIARFTQHHIDQLDMKKTALQWFQEMYPTARHQDIRKHLGSMGLTGNLAVQPIWSLSGGQKSRVAFANITWNKPSLILLDEPSNHLDLETIESLIRALNNYSGGLVIVSHDEYMITSVCDQIWVCENNNVAPFPGDFDDYKKMLQKKKSSITL